jgi:Eukaryotic aspartyl protease
MLKFLLILLLLFLCVKSEQGDNERGLLLSVRRSGLGHYAQLRVGTPPQLVWLRVDTDVTRLYLVDSNTCPVHSVLTTRQLAGSSRMPIENEWREHKANNEHSLSASFDSQKDEHLPPNIEHSRSISFDSSIGRRDDAARTRDSLRCGFTVAQSSSFQWAAHVGTSRFCQKSSDVLSLDVLGGDGAAESTRIDYCLSEYTGQYFADARDGLLGLAYNFGGAETNRALAESYTVFALLGKKRPRVFAMMMNGGVQDSGGSIELGGYDRSAPLVWSEPMPRNTALHRYYMPLFHLSLCGESLLPAVEAMRTAVLYSDLQCLALPSALFDRVAARIGTHCSRTYNAAQVLLSCRFTNRTQLDDVPPLVFQLAEDGPPLFLSMAKLVLSVRSVAGASPDDAAPALNAVFCIQDLASVSAATPEFILLGTRAMSQFYAVFDLERARIGLAPALYASELTSTSPSSSSSPSTSSPPQQQPDVMSCRVVPLCDEHEHFDALEHECVMPSCGYAAALVYNIDTDSCEIKPLVRYIVIAAAVVILCVEMASTEVANIFMRRARALITQDQHSILERIHLY